MTVENSVTYISDLNPTLPLHDDPMSQADTHFREIKSALKTTFAAITGAVTASHTDLNTTTGLAARVTAVEGNRVRNDQDGNITGSLTVSGSISAAAVKQGGNALIPSGSILIWSGAANAIPAGWLLCDGTNGTPDLRDRFVIGAGNSYTVGQSGGSASLTLTTAAAGLHGHGGSTLVAGNHGHAATCDSQGAHSHGGATSGTGLSVDMLPNIFGLSNVGGAGLAAGSGPFFAAPIGSANPHVHGIQTDGTHSHSIGIVPAGDHAHGINSDGTHIHTLSFDNRPPYLALAYIMKS